jgi:hypothetical protein
MKFYAAAGVVLAGLWVAAPAFGDPQLPPSTPPGTPGSGHVPGFFDPATGTFTPAQRNATPGDHQTTGTVVVLYKFAPLTDQGNFGLTVFCTITGQIFYEDQQSNRHAVLDVSSSFNFGAGTGGGGEHFPFVYTYPAGRYPNLNSA